MNRAALIVAAIALLVLAASGGWLLLNSPRPAARLNAPCRPEVTPTANRSAPANVPPSATPTPNATEPAKPDPPPATDAPTRPALPPLPRATETEPRRTIAVTISGEVVDGASSPVEAASVWVEVVARRKHKAVADEYGRPLRRIATTDSAGQFAAAIEQDIYESATLTLYISAMKTGYGPSTPVAVAASAGGHYNVSLTLREAGAVKGRVVDVQGQAIAGVRVVLGKAPSLEEAPARRFEYFEAVTDAEGRYAFADVPRGIYALGVVSAIHNARNNAKEVRVAEGVARPDDIVLELVTSLRIRFVDEGGAGVHGPLTLLFNADGKLKQRMTAFVTGDGVVEIPYPPVGQYEVVVRLEGYLEIAPRTVRVEFARTTDVGEVIVRKDPNYVKQR